MKESITRIALQPEEEFLWECAQSWRTPTAARDPQTLDWPRVVSIGAFNRMQTLLRRVLEATEMAKRLPQEAREALQQGAAPMVEAAAVQSEGLREYLNGAASASLESVVHKGLSLAINVYGDATIRPGGDIDILVRASRVDDAVRLLEQMGLGRYWPGLLDDRYYERHHLHQQRSSLDYKLWFEIHWALDHPYTLLTIDYEALMDRATPGHLLGEPVYELSLPDLLLTLSIHLEKHAVYLPGVLNRPDLARIILADGMLMYYVDVAEVLRRESSRIDWDRAVGLAKEWGAAGILGRVLRVCDEFLCAPVPEAVLRDLNGRRPGFVTCRVLNRAADYRVATHSGQSTSRFWGTMLSTDGAFIMRPIRVLDYAAFSFPDSDYLVRRYGDDTLSRRAKHLVRAVVRFARIGIDAVFYALKRRHDMRANNRR